MNPQPASDSSLLFVLRYEIQNSFLLVYAWYLKNIYLCGFFGILQSAKLENVDSRVATDEILLLLTQLK